MIFATLYCHVVSLTNESIRLFNVNKTVTTTTTGNIGSSHGPGDNFFDVWLSVMSVCIHRKSLV